MTFSYFTSSWLKYKIKKGATAQEVFIVCNKEFQQQLKEKIDLIINKFWC
jgi:hypothetical protein